jgi:metal-responsive CopG/Arc/MetJ family transcriptional regulator
LPNAQCWSHIENVSNKRTHRAHILLPDDLVTEIDALVGPRGRSAFLVETARNEVRRRALLRFLQDREPAWKDEDHPELAEGVAAWISRSRAEDDASRSRKQSKRKR